MLGCCWGSARAKYPSLALLWQPTHWVFCVRSPLQEASSCLLLAARKNSSAADPTHLFNCYGLLCPFHALSL